MTDKGQLYIFFVCVLCGAIGGILYDVFDGVQAPFHSRILKIIAQFCFCAVFVLFYIYISVWLGLPDFRAYMFLGCFVGFLLYLKSFHEIVAFFAQRSYNEIKRLLRKSKERRLCRKTESRFRKIKRGKSR